jgi:acyl carrier protein
MKGADLDMIFERVVRLLTEQFGVEADEITEDTGMDDLGADSVDLVELSMNLEEEFGIDEMEEEDIASIHTVGDLVNYLRGKLGE